MGALVNVPVTALDPARFESVLGEQAMASWRELIEHGARELEGRVIWNVNSTARGGGVVELLQPLLGYARGAGVDARWLVISGEADFFTLTKRLHNHLHGIDGGGLAEAEHELYERTLAQNAAELVALVHPSDIVILHDPQTAGLVDAVAATGAKVIWRCHIGLDVANDTARQAWSFLAPYVLGASRYVFSRAAFAWEDLDPERITVIRPSIDPFSPKNAEQTAAQSLAILARARIVAASASGPATFTRADGTSGRVDRRAELLEEAPLAADDPVVLQVSRVGPAEGPVRCAAGIRRPHRAGERRASAARRAGDRGRQRRSRGSGGAGDRHERSGPAYLSRYAGGCTWRRCRWSTSMRTPRSSTRSSGTPRSSCRRASPRASG